MTTLSTAVWLAHTNGFESDDVTYRGHCFRIQRRRRGDDTCRLFSRRGPQVRAEREGVGDIGDTETVRCVGQYRHSYLGVGRAALKREAKVQLLHK